MELTSNPSLAWKRDVFKINDDDDDDDELCLEKINIASVFVIKENKKIVFP